MEGWLAAYEAGGLDPEWRETLLRIAARADASATATPTALAEALREVPRSVPYEGLEPLAGPRAAGRSSSPATTTPIPGHPYETAQLICRAACRRPA